MTTRRRNPKRKCTGPGRERPGTDWRRPVDSSGKKFAPWVRALVEKSGVYAIRSTKTREVLYVGSSRTCRLYDTCVRHFQRWRAGEGQGQTYSRAAVEVRVRVTENGQPALDMEADWIADYLPRDNRQLPAWMLEAEQDDAETPF